MTDDSAGVAQTLDKVCCLVSLSKLFRDNNTELAVPQRNRQDSTSSKSVFVNVACGLNIESNQCARLERDVLALPDHPVLTLLQTEFFCAEVGVLQCLSEEQTSLGISDDLLR